MKAIVYKEYGSPDVLHLADLPEPDLGEDEVMVRVRAAEATKADCELRAFKFSVGWFWLPLRLALGVTKPRRPVLGGYFAGEIVAVGKECDDFSVGMSVFGSSGFRFGAYGELVNLPQSASIAEKPENMSFEEAAAVPLGGLNALHFMRLAQIKPGDQVLILGGGGSIGLHAIQIAKSMGAEVTAVDHGNKEHLVRRFGVDHFVDYTREDIVRSGRTYDVIFDMVPSSSYSGCVKSLKPGGRYLMGNPRFSSMLRALVTNRMTDKTVHFAFAKETVDELRDLKVMIEKGDIKPIVGHTFPMDQAGQAHHLVETEERQGAVVIEVGKIP